MGNHDPTTSMFHCWLDAIFHKFLPRHPPDVHSSITPMQTKPGLITKNGLGPLFSCPILVGSCKLQSSLLVSRCEVWLLSRHAANVVQPLLATPSRGGSRHTGTRLKLHLCLYLWNSLMVTRHAFSSHGSVFSPRCLSLSSWNLEV